MKYSSYKKILYAVLLVAVAVLFYFVWVWINPKTNVGATTEVKWTDTSSCKPTGCGTTEGTKEQERTVKVYADPICPDNYHYQNEGNWNERCHRDHRWQQPEHQAPSCPEDYKEHDNKCVKNVVETRTVGCKVDEEDVVACEPTPEPQPSPEPSPEPKKEFSGSSAPQGPACEAPTWAPTVTFTGRKDADTVSFKWTQVRDNLHTYLVWYGTEKDNLPWNTIVTGESVDLNDVPNTHIWAKVAAYDNGCVGPYSETIDP